jgi:hypothetical protein
MHLEEKFLDQPVSERRDNSIRIPHSSFTHHGKYDIYLGDQRLADEGVRAEMMRLIRERAAAKIADGTILNGVKGVDIVQILDEPHQELSQDGIADTGINMAPQSRAFKDDLIYAPGRGLYLNQEFTARPIDATVVVNLVRQYLRSTGTFGRKLRAISVASPQERNISYSAELEDGGGEGMRLNTVRLHRPQIESRAPELDAGSSYLNLSMFVHGPIFSRNEVTDPRQMPLVLRLSGPFICTHGITDIAMNAGVITPFAVRFVDEAPYAKLFATFNEFPTLDEGYVPHVDDLLDHFRACHVQRSVDLKVLSEKGMRTSGFGIRDLRQDEPISYQGHLSDKGTFIGVDSNTFDVAIHPLTSMIRATW